MLQLFLPDDHGLNELVYYAYMQNVCKSQFPVAIMKSSLPMYAIVMPRDAILLLNLSSLSTFTVAMKIINDSKYP